MLPKKGTATDTQFEAALRVLGKDCPSPLNYEKAGEILSAINYAAAVRATIRRNGYSCIKSLKDITQFIRLNLPIHIYAIEWAKGRFSRGTHNGVAPLPKNAHFHKVYAFATDYSQ